MPELRYSVDMVSQRTSPTCWLACAIMVYQYKRRSTPPSSWLEADTEDFRGPVTAVAGASDGLDQVLRMQRMGFVNLGIRETEGEGMRPRRVPAARSAFASSAFAQSAARTRTPSPEDRIHLMLLELGPFILGHFVGAFSYGPGIGAVANPTGAASHAVVITGVNTERKRVFFHNPWGQTNVMTSADSIVAAGTRYEQVTGIRSIQYLP